MYKFYINDIVVKFDYYYLQIFNPKYRRNEITKNAFSRLINKYYICKSIHIYENKDKFLEYLETIEHQYENNSNYILINDFLNTRFFDRENVIDIASAAYCLSRQKQIVSHLELDLSSLDIQKVITMINTFLSIENINIIKDIYLKIFENYNEKSMINDLNGLFLYTSFELNKVVLQLFLKYLLYDIQIPTDYIVFNTELLIFAPNEIEMAEIIHKLKTRFLDFKIYLKIEKNFNLIYDDVIVLNNILIENYSGQIKLSSCEFIKWQLENQIEQQIPLSDSSEILLLDFITNRDFNALKNKLKNNEFEYLKKIKIFFDSFLSRPKNGSDNL